MGAVVRSEVKASDPSTMSTQGEAVHVGKVLSFLREWDRGGRSARGRMLSSFLGRGAGRTRDELEGQFAQVASLFLARLTSWITVSYPSVFWSQTGNWLSVEMCEFSRR